MLDRFLRDERPRLMRQARSHSRRPEDADDALGDACVQFLRSYDGPAGEDALRWMLLVIKRCAWAIGRKSQARETRHGGAEYEATVANVDAPGPAELVERAEETAQMVELIENLKPDERTALILLGLGCSRAEIRELRGWSAAKVHRCIVEGREQVRRLLERGDS
jgi:RNA polymerase sigma factor (sigma-70 family)